MNKFERVNYLESEINEYKKNIAFNYIDLIDLEEYCLKLKKFEDELKLISFTKEEIQEFFDNSKDFIKYDILPSHIANNYYPVETAYIHVRTNKEISIMRNKLYVSKSNKSYNYNELKIKNNELYFVREYKVIADEKEPYNYKPTKFKVST